MSYLYTSDLPFENSFIPGIWTSSGLVIVENKLTSFLYTSVPLIDDKCDNIVKVAVELRTAGEWFLWRIKKLTSFVTLKSICKHLPADGPSARNTNARDENVLVTGEVYEKKNITGAVNVFKQRWIIVKNPRYPYILCYEMEVASLFMTWLLYLEFN